jgi:hypothetical protein
VRRETGISQDDLVVLIEDGMKQRVQGLHIAGGNHHVSIGIRHDTGVALVLPGDRFPKLRQSVRQGIFSNIRIVVERLLDRGTRALRIDISLIADTAIPATFDEIHLSGPGLFIPANV